MNNFEKRLKIEKAYYEPSIAQAQEFRMFIGYLIVEFSTCEITLEFEQVVRISQIFHFAYTKKDHFITGNPSIDSYCYNFDNELQMIEDLNLTLKWLTIINQSIKLTRA